MLLLHLSDIHFSRRHSGMAMDPHKHVRNCLELDAVAQCDKLGRAPDAILVSGDVAFAGHPEEYKFAQSWLEALCDKVGARPEQVFVVPGNHDVDRSIAGRVLTQSLHRALKALSGPALERELFYYMHDQAAAETLYQSIAAYNDFAKQFFCDLKPPQRTVASRDLELNDGSILRLSGFNSSFVSSVFDKEGDLFVDPACLQLTHEVGVEHAVLCHHPYNWLRQGRELADHLQSVARLHIFGHEHVNRVVPGNEWMQLFASAAQPDKEEADWEPGYNLIEAVVRGTGHDRHLDLKAHVRKWQFRPGEFVPKYNRGADVFAQSIKLGPWNKPLPASMAAEAVSASGGTVVADIARVAPSIPARALSIRFFKLTLSQRSAIAGVLNLLEEEDANEPDFERFRRVFLRAQARGLLDAIERSVSEYERSSKD
jgi:predicted phosphodiesterase